MVFVPVIIIFLVVAFVIAAYWHSHRSSHVLDYLDEIIGLICLVGNHHLRIHRIQTLDQGG